MAEPRTQMTDAAAAATVEARLYAGGRFIEDRWQPVADHSALPESPGGVLVSLSFWRSDRERLISSGRLVGVVVRPPEMLGPEDDIERLSLVSIPLAKFTDGRAYSVARRLRDQFGYRGALRVTGDVLLDQLNLLARCGFDEFEITNAPTIRALEADRVVGIAHVYQPPDGARRLPLMRSEQMRRRQA